MSAIFAASATASIVLRNAGRSAAGTYVNSATRRAQIAEFHAKQQHDAIKQARKNAPSVFARVARLIANH